MKESSFNYIVPNGDHTIFFNGITESFFEIPKEKTEIYTEIIQNPSEYENAFKPFFDKMIDKGFILEDNVDENSLLEEKFHNILCEDLYHIMILPTYQCNLRCWYCVQEHEGLWMTEECVEQIKELLCKKVKDKTIKKVRLSWFGGEPLLGYNIIIDLTSFVKRLTSEYDKTFVCDITTNGTLLNRNRIDALREAGVTSYQITIDGDKKTHDSIKVLPTGSAYDKTIENINIITETTQCLLRFNYTHDNLTPQSIISDLESNIKPENRHNITFLLYKVWQEPQNLINSGDVDEIVNLSSVMGLKPLLPTCNQCYSDCVNFNCIFPNGKVEKCDNESPLTAKGSLVTGEIIWDGNVEAHTPAFNNPSFPCRKCKYVPICWGPCVAKRSVMLDTKGMERCQYSDKDKAMKKLIINRCSNTKRITIK